MDDPPARERATKQTRRRILDVALEVLGRRPDAGMGEIAAAAGVVRRTMYGHFATRADLVQSLAQRAAEEVGDVLSTVSSTDATPERQWTDFVTRLWPLAHRYRVLIALRRGEHGVQIHALLEPVDRTLADLVRRGQDSGEFGQHLPADVLAPLALAAVFTIADSTLPPEPSPVDAAVTTTLLLLGVRESGSS